MQKKLIALAVAGAVAAPAFADSNVTLYGLFDIGFKSNTVKAYNAAGAETGKTTTRNFFGNQGLKNGNRLGVKGSEDLGNGVSAIFLYEMGMSPATAAHAMSNRQSYVGLQGGFGTVTFGRQYTLQYNLIDGYDLSGDYGMNNAISELVGTNNVVNGGDNRLSNAVLYTTPNFGGFDFSVMGAKNTLETTAGGVLAGQTNAEDYQLGANYGIAGLTTSLVYVSNKLDNFPAIAGNVQNKITGFSYGVAYDFTVAKLAGAYNAYKFSSSALGGATTSDNRMRDWMIAASAPVGPLTLGAQYSSGKFKNNLAGGAILAKPTGYALTAGYDLSKRTGLVFGYANGKAKSATVTLAKETSYGMSLQHRF